MDYSGLTAKELRELCEKQGIKPSRAKADMIEDLLAREVADELTKHDQENGLYGPLPPVEEDPGPSVHPAQEPPAETPPAVPEETVWVEDGRLHKAYPRTGPLLDVEHATYLDDVREEAVSRGEVVYGPAFRLGHRPGPWVYAIHVR